ncbi:MAG: hypothetical protein H7Y43_03265 [Akkermansiaceae bacterium]|nr:hypothetical protein [Verrucomicrobiales bacterium]
MNFAERIRKLAPEQKTLLLEALGQTRQAGGTEMEIAAYVVCRAGQSVSVELLKSALASQLPAFMVPAHFALLEALPLHPNGKVNRTALPALKPELPAAASQVQPHNETQARLAAIWAEVLRVQQVGIDDNFFKLGGHSLLALQVMAKVRDRFKADLPLKTLFEFPTVAGLAGALAEFLAHPPAQASRRIIPRRTAVASASADDLQTNPRLKEI